MPMEAFTAVLTVVALTLLICNVLGNVLVILVIHRNKKLQNANTFLLANLASSDIFFAIQAFTNIGQLVFAGFGQYSFSQFILRALVSIFTLVALAVERYFAILRPFVHLARAVKSLLYKVVFGIWILATVLTAPGFFILIQDYNYAKESIATNGTTVAPVWFEALDTTYSFVLFVFGLIIPSTVMIFCYSRVIYHVWFDTDANRATNVALLKSRRKLTKLFISVTVIFIITWTPTFTKLIVTRYIVDAETAWKYELSIILLGLVGTTANPVIYSFRCSRFRHEVIKLLTCRCCKGRRQPNVSRSFLSRDYSITHTGRRSRAAVEPVVLVSMTN